MADSNSKGIQVLMESLELANRITVLRDLSIAKCDAAWESIMDPDKQDESMYDKSCRAKYLAKCNLIKEFLNDIISGVNGLYAKRPDDLFDHLYRQLN